MKLKSLLIVVVTLFISSSINAQKWVTFSIADANFQIKGPPIADVKTDKTEEENTNSVSFTIGGQVYICSAAENKRDMPIVPSKSLAKASVDAVIEAFSGTDVILESYFVNKTEGLQAIIEKAGYDNPIYYKVVIINKIQYQLTVLKKEGALDKKGMKKFFKSFKVLK